MDEVLGANKVQDVTISIPSPRRPIPPAPLSPGTVSNPGYEVPWETEDQESEPEDEYVNVTDRFKGKVREIKNRVSGVFHNRGNYENEDEINRIRAKHEERRRKKELSPSRKAPAPPGKKDISNLINNNKSFLDALSRRLGGKSMAPPSHPGLERENSQTSNHSYLDLTT